MKARFISARPTHDRLERAQEELLREAVAVRGSSGSPPVNQTPPIVFRDHGGKRRACCIAPSRVRPGAKQPALAAHDHPQEQCDWKVHNVMPDPPIPPPATSPLLALRASARWPPRQASSLRDHRGACTVLGDNGDLRFRRRHVYDCEGVSVESIGIVIRSSMPAMIARPRASLCSYPSTMAS